MPNDAETLARKFHEIYERLAPHFGYETRKETRDFDPESNNGRLMIAVCAEILAEAAPPKWISVDKELPPHGITVETKVDDSKGVRNEQKLKLLHRLWFIPDGSMYVYYAPTHWRPLTPDKPKE